METIKAGCFLLDFKNKRLALIYRDNYDDYSFPKGHLEDGETIVECAIRETNEETKRDCEVLNIESPYIDRYITSKGEACVCYMYIAKDKGVSDNQSLDTHKVVWTDLDKVEETLSYPNLKRVWKDVYPIVLDYLNKF